MGIDRSSDLQIFAQVGIDRSSDLCSGGDRSSDLQIFAQVAIDDGRMNDPHGGQP